MSAGLTHVGVEVLSLAPPAANMKKDIVANRTVGLEYEHYSRVYFLNTNSAVS